MSTTGNSSSTPTPNQSSGEMKPTQSQASTTTTAKDKFIDHLKLDPYSYIDPQCSCATEVRRECPREFNSAFFCHNRQVDMGRRNRVEPNMTVCKKEFSMLFKCMEKAGVDFHYEQGSITKR